MGTRISLQKRSLIFLVLSSSMAIVLGVQKAPATGKSEDASPGAGTKLRRILEAWIPMPGDEDAKEEAAGGMPEAMSAGANITPSDLLSVEELKRALPWRPPDYSGQTGALGWSETVFDVPEGMRDRVRFWRDIYAKYTTDQGVLHDKIHLNIVYDHVDFREIMEDPSKSRREKHVLRERLVNDKREAITQRLLRLHGRTSSEGLSGEDLRYWQMFESVNDPDKFQKAAGKSRVRFQLGQKDRFLMGIYYSGRYLKEMERIFRDEGLPIELTRLPFVESSFNINAKSRVGASGVWQFMPRTARAYMKVNNDVDERNDPFHATFASAKVLRQNYGMLQSWPLAVTGYNHGAYGIRRISSKLGTNDLVEIIRNYSSGSFGFASENFYACFLAALEVEKDALKYFGDAKWSREVEAAEIKVTKSLRYKDLLSFFDNDDAKLIDVNPHLSHRVRKGRSSIPRGTFVRVPPVRKQIAENFVKGRLSRSKLRSALRNIPVPLEKEVAKSDDVEKLPPESESGVRPRLEKVSASAAVVLPALTGESFEMQPPPESASPSPGESLQLDSPAQAVQVEAEVVSTSAGGKEPQPRVHTVKRGDTLIGIAKKYNVDVVELKRVNGMVGKKGRNRNNIFSGQILKIPDSSLSN